MTGPSFGGQKGILNDWDKASSFPCNARHSTSSLGLHFLHNVLSLTSAFIVTTIMVCVLGHDPTKRGRTLADRGLDFDDAVEVFDGVTAEVQDLRKDFGEPRIICFGLLVTVVWFRSRALRRGADRHIISMRKANDREKARLAPLLGL